MIQKIARAITEAKRRGALARLEGETATDSAYRRAHALLAVFEDGRVWVRGKDSIQDVANEITASERLAHRRGRVEMRREAKRVADMYGTMTAMMAIRALPDARPAAQGEDI